MRTARSQPPALRSAARRRARPARRRGFSLIEALVSAVIVALMLVASLNLLGSAARSRASDNDRRVALMLAQQLMSEIQQQQYKDEDLLALLFGPELFESNGTRSAFDDVDDYNNFMDKPVALKDGTPVAGYGRWQRKVKVSWVSPTTLAEAVTDTGLVLVEVKVSDPRGREVSVYALRSQHAAPADPPTAGTAVLWTGIDVVSGSNDGATTRHTVSGVNPVARPVVKSP